MSKTPKPPDDVGRFAATALASAPLGTWSLLATEGVVPGAGKWDLAERTGGTWPGAVDSTSQMS